MIPANREEGLKKVIGIPELSLSIINSIIGAGIFALPGIIGVALGAFGIVGFIFCGIMMAAIMLCYAEIGTKVTSSGGSYAYVEAAFGSLPSYIVNWLYFFGWGMMGSAALVNIIADSLAVIFPVFMDPFPRGILFFILISFMVLVNIRGARQGILVVKMITIIKILPLIALIVFGTGLIKTTNLYWDKLPSFQTFGGSMLVLFFAFAGFETCLGASGEIKEPKKTIPWGILIGATVVLVLYMFLQMVTQGVLGDQIALYKDAPLAAVAARIVGSKGATILLLAAAISCFGSVFMDILATPRNLFAMSKDGLFPVFFSKVHKRYATPYWAILFYGGGIFLFSISGGFKQLASLASAAILLIYLAVVLAMVKLRKQKELRGQFFKAPGGWITPIIGTATICWLLTSLSRTEIISTLVFIAIIILFFYISRLFKRPSIVDEINK